MEGCQVYIDESKAEIGPSDHHDIDYHVMGFGGSTLFACSGHHSHNSTNVKAVGPNCDAECQARITKRSLDETTSRMF